MVYDWIKNLSHFRVQVPDVEGAKALLDSGKMRLMADMDETKIRDIEGHDMAVVYISPADEKARSWIRKELERLDKIGA